MAIKNKKLIIILPLLAIVFFAIETLMLYVYESKFEQLQKEAWAVPVESWDKPYQEMSIKDKYKVVFVTTYGGEYSYAKYFQYAAERIGWEVKIYNKSINEHDQEVLAFDPDFILYAVNSDHNISTELMGHRSKKYLNNLSAMSTIYNWGEKHPSDITNKLKEMLKPFHGVLSVPKELEILKQVTIEQLNRPFYGVGVLPTTPSFLNITSEPYNLVWGGYGVNDSRATSNYKKFLELLSKNIPMKIYGPYSNLSFLTSHVYDGFVPSGIEQINAIKKNGLYLLTHSALCIKSGVPTLRIFEALVANVVIISDKHPFAIEHFGDNFLYFDQTADAETMYQQVKDHYDWIKANPEKAKSMADKAHKIFLEKFTLEKDLPRIAKMHEYVLKQEREMGLSYPIAY